jgi:N-methylhydantoinase A/oxoprolinase/acetone carboxylase beta subunit
MTLDTQGAQAAAERLAAPLKISALDVAWGVHEIANENMATAARIHLVERGKDPAAFTFVAFGGAGPLHAQAVARKLGVRNLIIPRNAGVMSAVGLLAAPLSFEVVRSHLVDLAAVDWVAVDRTLNAMSGEARSYLGVAPDADVKIVRTADMRYRGQGSECTITLPAGTLTAERADEVRRAFYDGYDELYGRHLEEVPVQFVNFRVRAVAYDAHFELRKAPPQTGAVKPAKQRRAYFPDAQGFVETAIYQHDDLGPGARFTGPAIVQSGEFSAVIGPRQECAVDHFLNLQIAF